MKRLMLWARALRVHYLSASLLPVLLGTVIARSIGPVSLFRFCLVLGGVLCYHAGANLVNDLYDTERTAVTIGQPFLTGEARC